MIQIANRTTMAGMSLGGQMVGETGKHVKKFSNNSVLIENCVAMDPAG